MNAILSIYQRSEKSSHAMLLYLFCFMCVRTNTGNVLMNLILKGIYGQSNDPEEDDHMRSLQRLPNRIFSCHASFSKNTLHYVQVCV
jgi:hypothetical protein